MGTRLSLSCPSLSPVSGRAQQRVHRASQYWQGKLPAGHAALFGVSGEPPMPVDCWHHALTTRHGAMHPAARSWHCALLPSQQRGKSTVAVLAATAPNLPACQSHADPCNTAAWRCLHKHHGHPTAAVVGSHPVPMLRPQASLGCVTSVFPRTSQRQKFL